MKITNLEITDPRMRGTYSDPFATVTVNEDVDEIGAPIEDYKKSSAHRLVPCGPFWAPEFRPNVALIHWYDLQEVASNPSAPEYQPGGYDADGIPDYGELNKIGLISNQLFPVVVKAPSDGLFLAMEVPRFRRLLRQFDLAFEWSLIVDEEAALRGLLKWRLEGSSPVCYGGSVPYSDQCFAAPTKTIVYRDTHLSLCRRHLAQHGERIRKARISVVNK